jgi:hypothetical protein
MPTPEKLVKPQDTKVNDTRKKKVTRRLNPEETMVRGPEFPVESDEELVNKYEKPEEILAHGYSLVPGDLDPFDNERNYRRVCPREYAVDRDPRPDERAYNYYDPAPGYGPKEKVLDQDSEDYGHKASVEGDHQDD